MSEIGLVLYQALDADVGLEIVTSDVEAFKRRFYKERRADPALAVLSLRTCPTDPDARLWIVKNPESANAPAQT